MKRLLALTAAMFVVSASPALAARPTQHVAEVRAAWAVDELCGGGWTVCIKRYPVRVFYACGKSSKCWKACYTHVERPLFGHRKYRCSTGKVTGRTGFLDYYFEY